MWEVFNIQDNEVLEEFSSLQEADEFIASKQGTELDSQLQVRKVQPKPVPSCSCPKLILCRGVPGSGKTTYAATHFPGIFHVENDMYFMRNGSYAWSKDELKAAINWCMSMVRNALENGLDVVVCNTFTKRRYVQAYKNLADELGASFEVHRCTGNFKNVHGLSHAMVESFKQSMEDWPGEILA